ncbi:hypothetical protein D0Z07_7085 [Hyphodiscus hymeniophilus]|uniref:Uncharacterized protein n=1 Tax=Hyphodiscus hymeniophilus TaxID=353542 RepID=A0A9P6VFZ0_9HELO|nr:hypothetical protein D0Z07_7085 [Hyphodiscus hymeniophilus]
MVFLTMSSAILEALEKIQNLETSANKKGEQHVENEGTMTRGGNEETSKIRSNKQSEEPSLSNPKLGNPISHGQVIGLSKLLKVHGLSPSSLDILLRGSGVYVDAPPPKPEPTSEYKALMARLRREEEARSYERMTNPLPPMETFAQRFPMSSGAHAFNSYQKTEPEDEITYADINRQMAMIANVLLSIVACAGALWVAARWWNTPARLALSMSGSLLVGIAEVVVYGGYIRRVGEAKGKEKDVKEVKEVLRTWVVGGGGESQDSVLIEEREDSDTVKGRWRKKEEE